MTNAVVNVELHGPAVELRLARVVVAAVERVGLEGLFGVVDKKAFEKWSEVVAAGEALEPGYLVLREPPDETGAELNLRLQDDRVTFFLSFHLTSEREALFTKLEKLVVAIHKEVCPRALIGPVTSVRAYEVSYPRRRPPPMHRVWGLGHMVDCFCTSFHRDHPKGLRGDVEKLCTAPLPEGAAREEAGDLTILRWLTAPPERGAFRDAAARQEQYFDRVLGLPRDFSFNDLGDTEETPWGLTPAKPMTLYQESGERGYKAIVPVDGKIDPEIAAELKEVFSRRKLDDGRPLRFLTLLVPNRENALEVVKEAHALGADEVFYADETRQGVWWNPFPPGEWL